MKIVVTIKTELDLSPEFYEKEEITGEEMLYEERKAAEALGLEYAYMALDREGEVEISLEAFPGGGEQ